MSFTLTCQQQKEDSFADQNLDPDGVQGEIDRLDRVLGEKNGFTTETYLIPSENSESNLLDKIKQFRADWGDNRENLLLVYYAGHGKQNDRNQSVWEQ